jgi:putative DNA primase/helicase
MTNRVDTDKLLSEHNIVDVISKHVTLTKRGAEHFGICPFHNDTKQSLQVTERKQIFKCFACGEGGDAIAFLTNMGRTFHEACEEISGGKLGETSPVQNEAKPKRAKVEWKQLTSTEAPTNGDLSHYRHGLPSALWTYRNEQGHILGLVCRFDTAEGKEVLPLTYRSEGSRQQWRWQGFDAPRPLYNLDRLAAAPENLPVVVVEGEKTADAAQGLLQGKAVVTTWVGGARAISKTDWTPIKGRKIILWPDNDAPGVEAMEEIEHILRPDSPRVAWVKNPSDAPDKWDVADADWTPAETFAFMKANFHDTNPYVEDVPEIPYTEEYDMDAPPMPDLPDEMGNEHADYFRLLGFFKTSEHMHYYYFYNNQSQTVFCLTAPQLSKSNLIQLAPLSFWESAFPSKSSFSDSAAANWIIRAQQAVGFFRERYVRGRGAWIDDGRVILHNGVHLIVDGSSEQIGRVKSRFIYEQGEPLGINAEHQVRNAEAARILEMTKLLNWEREIDAYLLAGWCVIAPLCGALRWRPHIWLTGAAGTGKSWVFEKFVKRLLGESALCVQGETSEAGLRQSLGHDALPVVFDEAEGNEKKDQDRIQAVLSLMRQSSAEDGGFIVKGSSGGTSKSYRIRSCFAFASIAVQLSQQADRTRVTVLSLRELNKADGEDNWQRLQKTYEEVMTDQFVRGIQGRSLYMAKIIIANAATFANAAASVIGRQRTGDQLGALLAGAYSLVSDKVISYEGALAWIKDKDWSEERGLDKTKDEIALLGRLLEQVTRIETGGHGILERSVGELVQIAARVLNDSIILPELADERLRRLGMKVVNYNELYVSNTADFIRITLKDTAWAKNWNKILVRAEGARAVDSTRFASGVMSRAVAVPIAFLNKE